MDQREREMWFEVKLLAADFDGVMTDGKIIVGTDGVESVVCSHLDGQGKDRLRKINFPMVIISTQKSDYVAKRGHKLGIDYFYQVSDKVAKLKEYLAEKFPGLTFQDVCFVGDDHSDLEIMQLVGLPVAPANATDEIKGVAKYVTKRRGGDGAFREVCDHVLAARAPVQEVERRRVLITGTGQEATGEVCRRVEETAYLLAQEGCEILTNSGPNGVPWAAAAGAARARAEGASGRSVAYAYNPDLKPEDCGTTTIRYFRSYEECNSAICHDAEAAIFFQGGLGTLAKLTTLLQRVTHINGLLEKKGRISDIRRKSIVIDGSFAADPEAFRAKLGNTIKPLQLDAMTFVGGGSPEDIAAVAVGG